LSVVEKMEFLQSKLLETKSNGEFLNYMNKMED
jgi:transcription termination factor Rho